MTQQFSELVPLNQMEFALEDLLAIKRNDLLPAVDNQALLNHYADQLIQAQSVLLKGIDSSLTQQLSRVVTEIIQKLAESKKTLKVRKFNALQKWFGSDVESLAQQIHYLNNLENLIAEAHALSQKVQLEIQKSQSRLQQAMGLREQMAKYILAAEQFLSEYPDFIKRRHTLEHFTERLSHKVNTLQSLQASNDIALLQMQLTQQLSYNLLDRFKEAEQVLIPAWQYHLKHSRQQHSPTSLIALDASREKLIETLKQSFNQQ